MPPSRREVLVSAAALASFSAEGMIQTSNTKTAASSPSAGMTASGPSSERSLSGSAMTDDGVRLYFEETGSGVPVVLVHEFAGDHRSWEPQVRFLSRWFRCITFNARGYPPSDVPEDATRYSQARARDDIRDVLAHLRVERAHTERIRIDKRNSRLRWRSPRLGSSMSRWPSSRRATPLDQHACTFRTRTLGAGASSPTN